KTYAGQGIDDPSATVRLDISPAGFHAQVLSPKGAVYVDPAFRGDAESHVSYFRRDFRKSMDEFRCLTVGQTSLLRAMEPGNSRTAARTLSGMTGRTYRLAVAATGE